MYFQVRFWAMHVTGLPEKVLIVVLIDCRNKYKLFTNSIKMARISYCFNGSKKIAATAFLEKKSTQNDRLPLL